MKALPAALEDPQHTGRGTAEGLEIEQPLQGVGVRDREVVTGQEAQAAATIE